jgi:hypothetical protein
MPAASVEAITLLPATSAIGPTDQYRPLTGGIGIPKTRKTSKSGLQLRDGIALFPP